jgi:hypothetical protein
MSPAFSKTLVVVAFALPPSYDRGKNTTTIPERSGILNEARSDEVRS